MGPDPGEHDSWLRYRRMESIFQTAGGMAGLKELAAAWHTQVMADEVVAHAFSHGYKIDHTERLAAYWAAALGGPAAYTDTYGDETSVVRLHSGNGPHDEMNLRAIACFDAALLDVGWPRHQRLGQTLHDYFSWATLGSLDEYHDNADDVPERLPIPKWSWDGPIPGSANAH